MTTQQQSPRCPHCGQPLYLEWRAIGENNEVWTAACSSCHRGPTGQFSEPEEARAAWRNWVDMVHDQS